MFECAGEHKVLARKAGAIEALTAAMRAHADNAGVLEQACGAMLNFCINNGAFAFHGKQLVFWLEQMVPD